MNATSQDGWDTHWEQFAASAEIGPTPRYRRRLIAGLLDIEIPGEGVRFLELGSGTGEFAGEFRRRYPRASYLGLELSRSGIEMAEARVPGAKFVQRDLLQPPSPGEPLDYGATHALCSEVLEHLDAPEVFLRNAASYFAPGCRLIVTVPGGPVNAFYRHIGHRRHYAPAELARVLDSCGFAVESTSGAGFPFFNLFRLLLNLRGRRLVSDVSGQPPAGARIVGAAFDALFRLNSRRSGWQTLGIALWRG